MDARETLGYWIRRRRKALDLTQAELAQRVGCAVITLRKIEADERRPSRQMAECLAQCLALSAEETADFLAVASGEHTASRLQLSPAAGGKPPPHNLPLPMHPLIGRSDELTKIINCLRRKEVRLHTLTGPVGVGKTRLAIEAGLHLCQEFRDGVWLVTLELVQDPERLARRIVDLIEKPQRAMFISRVYEVPVLLNKLFPGLMDRLSAGWVRHKRKNEIPPLAHSTPVEYQTARNIMTPLWLAAGSLGMMAIIFRLITSKTLRKVKKKRRIW